MFTVFWTTYKQLHDLHHLFVGCLRLEGVPFYSLLLDTKASVSYLLKCRIVIKISSQCDSLP